MSWAAENPEAYEALERSAVARWLRAEEMSFLGEEEPQVLHIELVETLQYAHPEIFRAMLDAGATQLIDYSEHEAFVPIMPKDIADILIRVEDAPIVDIDGSREMGGQFVPGR